MMIVVAIMAIIMTMGVPIVYRVFHKEALTQAVTEVVEVCSHARARAILQGHMTQVVFHPKEGRVELDGGGGTSVAESGAVVAATGTVPAGSGLSTKFSDQLTLQMLDVNLSEYKDADLAYVRFYPNGTCDEMTLILQSNETTRQKGVRLEVTTGLASILNQAELEALRDGRL